MALEVTKLSRHSAHDAWDARGRNRRRVQPSEWPISDEFTQTIQADADIVTARERGRALARVIGFSAVDQAYVATAISELCKNMIAYAGGGELRLRIVDNGRARGVTIVARDTGPGIGDLDGALADGFSTSGGLGLGLPGVRRLMDRFDIESVVGRGTAVSVTKWSRIGRHTAA
jgi:serine/threonine-protein kinase RsbT